MVKSPVEIEKMRVAGRLAAEVLDMITDEVLPGISTGELDYMCFDHIVRKQGAIPANIGYLGFEKTICTSVNNVICHGIPDFNEILKDGDIINIDVTVKKDGFHGDTSKMFLVGKTQPNDERLVRITQECLYEGIRQVREGAYLGDIGHAIQHHAEKNHYSVVRDYGGHGIGEIYHDFPKVLHYGERKTGFQLRKGMCLTIEPMINMGTKYTEVLSDGWTVRTRDRRNSAQWEHTLVVTKDSCEVLTKRSEEPF